MVQQTPESAFFTITCEQVGSSDSTRQRHVHVRRVHVRRVHVHASSSRSRAKGQCPAHACAHACTHAHTYMHAYMQRMQEGGQQVQPGTCVRTYMHTCTYIHACMRTCRRAASKCSRAPTWAALDTTSNTVKTGSGCGTEQNGSPRGESPCACVHVHMRMWMWNGAEMGPREVSTHAYIHTRMNACR